MDSVVSTVVTPIINFIAAPFFQQIGYLFKAGSNVRNLKKICVELTIKKNELQKKITSATAASDEIVPTERVTEWMKEVQAMEAVLRKIDEDYNRRTTCLGRCPINCWSTYKISKRAANELLEAEDIMRKQQNFDVLTERRPPAIRRSLTLPDVTPSSTDFYIRKAFNYLQNEEVGMIGIWGMGGVGKTTVLKRINNHRYVETIGFDFVVWATVSQKLDLDKLRKDIAKRVGLTLETPSSLEAQAQALHRYLGNKSFLLFNTIKYMRMVVTFYGFNKIL